MSRQLQYVKEDLLESIFTYASDGISIVGLEGQWIKANPSVIKLLGYSEDELYNLKFQDITHRDDLESDLQQMNELLDGSIDNYQMEKRYFHKNGHVIWALLSVSMVRDDKDRPLYFISQVTDISAQKSAIWHLQFLMNVVSGQKDKLTDFARIATHDFRTHIGNLSSIVEFIEEENDSVCDTENFTMLKASIENLSETLKHLNLIRLDKPNSFNELHELSLYDYVTNAIYNVNALAKKHHCQIVNTIDESAKIWGIEAYLDSIILNFLTNAIKYRSVNRLPMVNISSTVEGKYIILKILDNGLGIDLKVNGEKLFTLNGTFHKHKDSRGIGLFITKSHIESIGGKIKVDSTVDEGTCFSVYFLKA